MFIIKVNRCIIKKKIRLYKKNLCKINSYFEGKEI